MVLGLLLTGVAAMLASPPPSEFVGVWKSEKMAIAIAESGYIRYVKVNGMQRTEISCPVMDWNGVEFSCALGLADFEIGRWPTELKRGWVMEVDGVELVKAR